MDFATAKATICETITNRISADATALLGYMPLIIYPRVVTNKKAPRDKHWLRINIRSLSGEQVAICTTDAGKKLYRNEGIIIVEMFAPLAVEGGEEQDNLAQLVQNAMRGRNEPGAVWFRHTAIKDVSDQPDVLRLNVTSEYNYRQLA